MTTDLSGKPGTGLRLGLEGLQTLNIGVQKATRTTSLIAVPDVPPQHLQLELLNGLLVLLGSFHWCCSDKCSIFSDQFMDPSAIDHGLDSELLRYLLLLVS